MQLVFYYIILNVIIIPSNGIVFSFFKELNIRLINLKYIKIE